VCGGGGGGGGGGLENHRRWVWGVTDGEEIRADDGPAPTIGDNLGALYFSGEEQDNATSFDPTWDLIMTENLVAISKYYTIVSMVILLASVLLLVVETLPEFRIRTVAVCAFATNGTDCDPRDLSFATTNATSARNGGLSSCVCA
jgi:hypothetical protein